MCAIWYDMLNNANIMYCTLPYCVLYHIIWFITILQFPNQYQLIAICTDHHNRRRFTILTVLTILKYKHNNDDMNTHCYNIENTCLYYKHLRDYGERSSCSSIRSSPLPEFELMLILSSITLGCSHLLCRWALSWCTM